MRYVCALATAALTAGANTADAAQRGFAAVENRAAFVQIISGRDLRRLGINVSVTPQGQISGRAFGYPVSGTWQWQGSYFCRDLHWGADHLGSNCQTVRISGDTIRFTADRGTGQSADLTLR
ncbi:MAG: dihydrodipicolinate reductase [Rhodobacterales bacterium]|nr:dihydrodipicolinate reductase [Rhodobacterales bacterium]